MLPTKFQSIGLSVHKFRVSCSFSSGEIEKNRFSRWHHGESDGMLASFDLLVTLMLPTKFQDNWLFKSGEEMKNDASNQDLS